MSQMLVSEDKPVVMTLGEARTLSRSLDRCDRCGAQAYYLARKEDGSGHELLFCNHHGVKFSAKLKEQGFNISNQSQQLFAVTKPDSSAAA